MHERRWITGINGQFARRLAGIGVALTLLLAIVAPSASAPLTFGPRVLYWALHIGSGLVLATLSALTLVRWSPNLNDWRLILLSGLIGVLLFAPLAYGLELLFPITQSEPDGDWGDRAAQTSVAVAILVEALELAPSYLAAWALINLGSITDGLSRVRRDRSGEVGAQDVATIAGESGDPADPLIDTSDHQAPPPLDSSQKEPALNATAFLDRLPPAVGRDVVCVSSDLHYLQVVTRKGRAMVLGALKEVEARFGDAGLRVHRSHWVHLSAVHRLVKSAAGWQLVMVSGDRIPVSRRKRTAVIEQIGGDFVVADEYDPAGDRRADT